MSSITPEQLSIIVGIGIAIGAIGVKVWPAMLGGKVNGKSVTIYDIDLLRNQMHAGFEDMRREIREIRKDIREVNDKKMDKKDCQDKHQIIQKEIEKIEGELP